MDIPFDRAPLLEVTLNKAGLLLCFKCNRQDFINEAGLIYADYAKNPGLKEALDRPGFEENSGFAFFAYTLWLNFTQAIPSSSAAAGRTNPPVFSAFLLGHLPQVTDWQRFMTKEGSVKYADAYELLTQFTWYVVIKAFESGIGGWQDKDLTKAKKLRQQLVDRKRELYCSGY